MCQATRLKHKHSGYTQSKSKQPRIFEQNRRNAQIGQTQKCHYSSTRQQYEPVFGERARQSHTHPPETSRNRRSNTCRNKANSVRTTPYNKDRRQCDNNAWRRKSKLDARKIHIRQNHSHSNRLYPQRERDFNKKRQMATLHNNMDEHTSHYAPHLFINIQKNNYKTILNNESKRRNRDAECVRRASADTNRNRECRF